MLPSGSFAVAASVMRPGSPTIAPAVGEVTFTVGGRSPGGGLAVVEIGDGDRDGLGLGLVTVPLQVTPLRVNTAGVGFDPVTDPLNPRSVDAFVPSDPFHARFVAVTR